MLVSINNPRSVATSFALGGLCMLVACTATHSESEPFESLMIETRGLTFEALAAGPFDGEVVLLLHGFPTTARGFESTMESLADAGYRAVAPNMRGYSAAARPQGDENYAITSIAADVVDISDALDADRVHVVGHDWGAAVGWMATVLHPDRIATLTALSIPHPAALAGAMADETTGQREASAYTELLRREDAVETLLAEDARKLRMFYGDDPTQSAMETFGVDVAGQGALQPQLVERYVGTVADPVTLDAALAYYRANWTSLETGESGARVSASDAADTLHLGVRRFFGHAVSRARHR